MSYRISTTYTAGSTLTFALKRSANGYIYDFSTSTFKSTTPGTLTSPLTESTLLPGAYEATISSTPASVFPDGDYVTYIIDTGLASVVGILGNVMRDGDDATVIANFSRPTGTVKASPTPSTAGCTVTLTGIGASATLTGQIVAFQSGALDGRTATILGDTINGSDHALTFAALPVAPTAGDSVCIL